MVRLSKWLLIALVITLIAGCASRLVVRPAPVTEGWRQSAAGKNAYTVQRRDTLYSIAWAFGLDYRDLARFNKLHPPYALKRGQRIYLVQAKSTHKSIRNIKPISHNLARGSAMGNSQRGEVQHSLLSQTLNTSPVPSSESVIVKPIKSWIWPAQGKIVATFDNKTGGNKGVDIGGSYGDPVLASAAGKVVYNGNGIRSYGNLIILKHSDDYLSAYAYNKKVVVKEGEMVQAGQKIAQMGRDDAGSVRLHFEIRRVGKPVNPLLFLK